MSPLLWCVPILLSAAAPKPIRLTTTGLTGTNVPAATVAFLSEHLAQQFDLRGVHVVTPREIQAVLGAERQKQMLQCAESSGSCFAELANAMGADALVLGDVGRFGESYQINLKIVAADDGRLLSVYSVRLEGEQHALEVLSTAADKMIREASQKLHRPLPAALLAGASTSTGADSSSHVREWSWIPAVGAVAFAGGAVFFGLRAQSDLRKLTDPSLGTLQPGDALTLKTDGSTSQTLGWAGAIVGSLCLAGAATMFFWPGSGVQASVTLRPQSVGLSVAGVFP